jgi:hypothetical protein
MQLLALIWFALAVAISIVGLFLPTGEMRPPKHYNLARLPRTK